MDNAQQQLVQKLKESNNVLVTVSRNPSVDQLSALLGLSLLLNKQGKHCAAVFSGQIPSTIEFLNPEETIEKNTDSPR
jgi:nanoRNase/pAp phosphatase (c-di-AMP/oligoRNAs hydrolase)